jgi:hypothetical protein
LYRRHIISEEARPSVSPDVNGAITKLTGADAHPLGMRGKGLGGLKERYFNIQIWMRGVASLHLYVERNHEIRALFYILICRLD